MKFAVLLASAFVATAVQASQVTLYYCQGDKCFDDSIEARECTDLEHPGLLTSIQNTADCRLFEFPGCKGRDIFVPRGSHSLGQKIVASVICREPGLLRNLAPAVQASEVHVHYCVEGGPCNYVSVEPKQCNHMEHPGYLTSIQNTADCILFKYPGCSGPAKFVSRGSHAGPDLHDKFVRSFSCSEPGLPRNLAPAVEASEVLVHYCVEGGPCNDVSVEPKQCNHMEHPGYLTSIQNTADCKLYEYPGCSGRVKFVTRGSHAGPDLQDKFVSSFSCSEPGLPRKIAPAVQAAEVTINYCITNGECIDQYVEPYQCTYLDVAGPIMSIQNTASCELFSLPNCGGRSIFVRRGSSNLQNPFAVTIKCSEPGFQRNQLPMRRH